MQRGMTLFAKVIFFKDNDFVLKEENYYKKLSIVIYRTV